MKTYCCKLLLLQIFPILSYAQSQEDSNSYQAGFKTIHTKDSSRIYRAGADVDDDLYYRPVDIDIWYPALPSKSDSTLVVKDFLSLFVNRPNYYRDSATPKDAVGEMAKAFCEMNQCSDATKLLYHKTNSYKNAEAINSGFPLVVYMASFGSNCFENFTLLEKLAKQGYFVVSISSIGRFPGEMTMKNEDMLQQVYDALFSINYLSQNLDMNFSKIGIVGYSWGGLAGAALASRLSNAGCLISLDGSEFHHFGESKEEDDDFVGITNEKYFKNMSLTVPYLRLEQNPMTINHAKKDSVYNFSEKLAGSKMMLAVDSAEHYHFCCLPSIVIASGDCKDNGLYNTITQLTISFLDDHLKTLTNFSQTLQQELNRTVKEKYK